MSKMEKLVFATNNRHKLEEVSAMTGGTVKIVSLAEIGCHDDIPETADTFQGNALQKAAYVYEHFGLPCFADDSGLEVDCLEGIPGVLSARYAGEHGNSEANIAKLLDAMKGSENRKADFKTVVALILPDGKSEEERDKKLKLVLSEVLRDLKKAGLCYIKYELRQGCFHITAR